MESIFKKQRILETILRVFVFEEKKRKKERREKKNIRSNFVGKIGIDGSSALSVSPSGTGRIRGSPTG